MNFGTFVVILVLAAVVILDIRYLIRHGADSCRGDCASCHGSCRWSEDIKQARKEIREEKQNSLRNS